MKRRGIIDKNQDELQPHSDKITGLQCETDVKYKNKQRIKVTIYLTEEAEVAFTELYIHRLRKDRKTDKSQVACEAIQALYTKECFPS